MTDKIHPNLNLLLPIQPIINILVIGSNQEVTRIGKKGNSTY